MHTKADFRATRERIGYTQQWVAHALNVDVRTVKRWENPNYFEPPADAWEWLEEEVERFEQMLDYALEQADGIPHVVITYYRTQEQFEQYGRDKGFYGFANALAREVAQCVDAEIEYRYPDSGAISTPGSRY